MEQKVNTKLLRLTARAHLAVANEEGYSEDDLTRGFILLAEQAADAIDGLTAENAELRYERDCANEELGLRLGAILELTTVRDSLLSACEKARELIGGMALAGSPWGSLPVLEQLHAAIAKATPPPMAQEIDEWEEGVPLTELQLRRIEAEGEVV